MVPLPSTRRSTDAAVTPQDVGDPLTKEQRTFALIIGRELAARWCADQKSREDAGLVEPGRAVPKNRC